jgi:hypothetical protein
LTPNSGKVGSTVTISITSSGFFLDGPYKVLWSPNTDFDTEKTILVKEGIAPKNVTEVTDSFTIPEAKYGENYVQFVREYRPDDVVNLKFTVKPGMEIIPAQAAPGTTVTVKCIGFPASGTGTVTFDGQTTNISIAPNEIGTFSAEFVVPNTMAGEHKFVANSPQLLMDSATASMKVIPAVNMNPQHPEVGADVVVTGRGFAANSIVQIKYDNVSIANSPTTNENGGFSYTFKVPESSTKQHNITAEDEAGNSTILNLSLEGTPPPKPTPIAPKAERFGWLGDETVTFAWTPVTDISGVTYNIEVGEDLNFFPIKPGMKKTGLTEPTCTMNINVGTYYWRVQAIDGVGNEGEWAISPYAFNVGFLSNWMLIAGGIVCLIVFILLIRAFFRRLRDYD